MEYFTLNDLHKMIETKLENENRLEDIEFNNSFITTLICPITKMRLEIPG